MRYSILNFNQSKAVENNLNLDDLVLLQYIMQANAEPYMSHILDENEICYVWLNHIKIQEDLPILGITEGTLKNKLSKLKTSGFINSKSVANKSARGTRTYYCITEKTTSLLNDVEMTTSFSSDVKPGPRHFKMTSYNKLSNDNNSCKSKDLHSSAQGANIIKTSQPPSYSINTYYKDIENEECFSKENDFNFGKGNSINKKPKKNSNENELVTCYTMIESFSENTELRKKLKDLFNMKKDICGKNRYHFSATTCMNYLDKLNKACKNENEMIGAVDLAIQYDACTTKIMIPRQTNNYAGKNANYRLPEQKIATDEDRARDIDGNYIVF